MQRYCLIWQFFISSRRNLLPTNISRNAVLPEYYYHPNERIYTMAVALSNTMGKHMCPFPFQVVFSTEITAFIKRTRFWHWQQSFHTMSLSNILTVKSEAKTKWYGLNIDKGYNQSIQGPRECPESASARIYTGELRNRHRRASEPGIHCTGELRNMLFNMWFIPLFGEINEVYLIPCNLSFFI